jgi:valyl-tRNA synthetase
MKLLIPMAGLIDKDAELERLARDIEKRASELKRCEGKLANSNFVGKAPAAVVQKERKRAAELQSALDNLREQQSRIATL